MGMDNVQLKKEDVLNDSVVLSDINPITNTNSVDDSVSGEKLNETLSRIWNAINNKLTRIVNSVNGRTGVVVLSAEDVGLGNVDNISFAEIKEWIRQLMEAEFVNRSLKLYNALAEVDEVCLTNDESYVGAPFFCDIIDENDKRSCIGCYVWNNLTSSLGYIQHPINTIGYTDGSIIYNEQVGSTDLRGGGIGVHIHPDEQALLNYNNEGLRIDPTKIVGKTYYFDSLYGIPSTNSATPSLPMPDSMLLSCREDRNGATVKIFINGKEITSDHGIYLDQTSSIRLRPGDIIITNFGWYGFIDPLGLSQSITFYDASTNLMFRQTAIGVVRTVPSDFMIDAPYIIDFNTIRPRVNFGLTDISINVENTEPETTGINSIIGLRFGNGFGLNTLTDWIPNYPPNYPRNNLGATPNLVDFNNSNTGLRELPMQTPFYTLDTSGEAATASGLFLTSDISIAPFSKNDFSPFRLKYLGEDGIVRYKGSQTVLNYAYDPSCTYTRINKSYKSDSDARNNGVQLPITFLSVNLNKAVMTYPGSNVARPSGIYEVYDMSGLRLAQYDEKAKSPLNHESLTEVLPSLGIPDGKDAVGNVIEPFTYTGRSGGLQINVGKFLEINPVKTDYAIDYHKGGKLQVRIGDGLKEDITYTLIDAAPDDWFANIDNYVIDDDGTYVPIPIGNFLTTEEPDDWRDLYQSYGTVVDDTYTPIPEGEQIYRLNDGETAPDWFAEEYYERVWDELHSEYVFKQLILQPENWESTAEGVPYTYKSYYVKRTQAPTWEANTYYFRRHLTFAEADSNFHEQIYRIDSSNRITINTDPETLAFTEDGKLTVVGGVGGSNIRIVDSTGNFFDTVPDRESIDDVMILGPGLKVMTNKIPPEVKIDTDKLRSYLIEIANNMTVVDVYSYVHINSLQQSITPYDMEEQVLHLVNTLNGATAADLTEYTNVIEAALTASDARIPDIMPRSYLTESSAGFHERFYGIFNSIDKLVNKSTIFQTIATHYNLEGDSWTKDSLYNSMATMVSIIDETEEDKYPLDWFFGLEFMG